MRLSGKFLIPIAGLVIVAAIVVVLGLNFSVQGLIDDQHETLTSFIHENLSAQAKIRQDAIYSSIDQVGESALKQASLFSEIPDIQDSYELALSGDINDENDLMMQHARQKMRVVMGSYVDGLTGQTDAEEFRIHFHMPSGRSLVRLWRSGWQTKRNGKKVDISDDLTSFRQSVVQINQGDHKPISGIEIGRGGFAIRGLSAVKGFDGEHVGSVEVLGSFNDVLKANHTDSSYQIAVYMLADLLPIATNLQDSTKNPILGDKFVFISSTDRQITAPVISPAQIKAGMSSFSEELSDQHFVATFPLPDFSGKVVGVMALVYDMKESQALIAGIEGVGQKTMAAMNMKFALGAALLVVILCATVYYVTRRAIGPLSMAVGAAQQIAIGDLSVSFDYKEKDEVGDLARAINSMIESLKGKASEAKRLAQGDLQLQVGILSDEDTMGQAFSTMVTNLNDLLLNVQQAAFQIDASSTQVSDTAQSLSEGSTQSAASLEEISSSMNVIGGQTRQSADNASQASRLAKATQSSAQSGSRYMGEMVAAMDEINEAGQSINKIIKVIDEIAFQTNLLALNAAVEAARAGQHGKGFAVVAEEVRNLAARSAKAAEETAELIQGSVEKAANGTSIAQKTADALDEIVGSIIQVNDLVAEIASASDEQAQGISQINQGLGQIDSAVQQSTATAEEAAASSQELTRQSAHLKHMLSRFKISGDANGPAASVPPSLPSSPRWGE